MGGTSSSESGAGRPIEGSGDPGRAAPDSRRPLQLVGQESDGGTRPRRGAPVWLLVVMVAVFSSALIWQVREARDLASKVDGLEARLADSRARVIAQRRHLQAVRAGVHGLADRVEALRTLVDEGPQGGRSADEARGEADSSSPIAEAEAAPPRIPARLESR